jgi:hypothetical protein
VSKINEYLNKIKTAIYGREVRDAIHDSIKECYTDVTSGATLANEASDKANAATEKANIAASNADTATANANSAANLAGTAASNADDKAALADTAASGATAAMNSANEAASNATDKAALADKATTNANNAANQASTAASNADNKAALADNAAGLIRRMNVSATHLPPGSPPTSSLETVEDASSGLSHYSLVLGIPTGNTGVTPALTFEVSTGAAGTDAAVEVTGTAEAPVVHLTIPKGDTGKIENLVINGKPVDNGTITLTAEDIGALPMNTPIPTKTSDLTNDSGFITADSFPVLSVNGKTGVVNLSAEDVGALAGTDATLTIAGKAADAKATGDLINRLKSDLSDLKFKHKRLYTSKDNAVNLGIDYGFVVLSFKADSDAGFSAFGSTLFCTIYSDDLIVLAEKHVSENAASWVTNVSYSNGVLSFNNAYTGIIDIIAIGT